MSFQFTATFDPTPEQRAAIYSVNEQLEFSQDLEENLAAALSDYLKRASFKAKIGKFLPLYPSQTDVLIGGIGAGLATSSEAEIWGDALYKSMKSKPFNEAVLSAAEFEDEIIEGILLGATLASYEFNSYFTKKEEESPSVNLIITGIDEARFKRILADVDAMADGVHLARDLVYEPANILYPESFAQRCEPLKDKGLEVSVLNEKDMKELGMGSLLGVGQGSVRESAIVIMNWRGGGDEAPLALVGKGVCFDTGGISIKPARGMEDMKWDMGGAAAVTGAMCALAGRNANHNVVGIIGLVENMPDGNAQRPGDVVTSMSGQTIEVINTDAEGRLVLADVLTYVQQEYKPEAIIDLATLTGAILVALGKEYAGLFSNNDALSEQITSAGRKVSEKSWRMPMEDAYDKMLKSHIADMKNIGGMYGGSITAACFLHRFVENNTPWAHIDIAGKAWSDKATPTVPAGGTGYGVRLLNQMIDDWQPITVS